MKVQTNHLADGVVEYNDNIWGSEFHIIWLPFSMYIHIFSIESMA
jgi:hypothetical protein